jgi:hypothetical protein
VGPGQDHRRGPRAAARSRLQRLSPSLGATSRALDLEPGRLARWVEGFVVRHGEPTVTITPDAVELSAPDGASALLAVPFGPWDAPAGGPVEVAVALAAHAGEARPIGVLVVRRGGYAAAVVAGGRIETSKVGRRHVQGRTAAGGWSQQRFARRRAKQTAELADASAAVAARILAGARLEWLVTGGDRPLVEAVLAEPELRAVAALPRGPHLAVGDPNAALVRDLPVAVTRVRVTLREPGSGS